MAKVYKTLRNNWKKTIFGCVASYYGINYLIDRRKEFLMMRALCEEAGKHGELPLPMGAHNKHITLFVNPAASGRKSKKKCEKFSEPLLHMAGFLVTVIKTEKVDEAKELTALIQKTNVIAVAGGDGTLSEVVTGLLRREDADTAARMYPIGIIPVGSQNEFASTLISNTESVASTVSGATMAIVKHKLQPKDVIEVQVVERPTEESESELAVEKPKLKPVYAMSGLRVGMFREALKKKDDMPSFFGQYFNTFWAFLRTNSEIFKAEIRYTPPCSGCLRCYKEDTSKNEDQSWISWIGSVFRTRKAEENPKPTFENEDCGVWTSVCVDTPEFNVKPEGDGSLAMEIGKKLGTTEFLLQGFKLIKQEKDTIDTVIRFNEAEIIPIQAPEFCSIDGDEFEVKPIHVRVLKKKLLFFTPS